MALVVFLPRPEILHTFWALRNKKSQIPEVALVDFGPDGRPCLDPCLGAARPELTAFALSMHSSHCREGTKKPTKLVYHSSVLLLL